MSFFRSHLIIISTYFLLLLIPYVASFHFNFTNISQHDRNADIEIKGYAYISNDGIQLTPNERGTDRIQKAGRATYISQLHLWDNSSGELASFTTDFSFVIDSELSTNYGDGLTFFLAQNNSVIIKGGAMGLPINATANGTMTTFVPFVAVEFDTYYNPLWDPRYPSNTSIGDHVGINVNSLSSVRYQKWWSNITGGRECKAYIKYDSFSKNLSVSFTGFQNNIVILQVGLDYIIDLRKELPEWVIFGLSAATGASYEENKVKSWSFNSSDIQIYENNERPTTSPKPMKEKRKTGNGVKLIVGLCVLVTFLAILAFVLWKKMKNKGDEVEEPDFGVEMNNEFEMGIGPKKFSYHELAQSTANFAEKVKLGEGGFGGVYKGFLKDSSIYIAVKRVSKSSKQGIKEYASEVKIISRLRHRNLVQLIGWCHEKGELLLVYDFMENGSLDSHLYMAKSLLTWGTRYKIAHGLASALLYLHEEWEQCVLHRDIKSSNVMLDSNFNAKLGDFGLAKLVDHENGSQTTMVAGTMGYMAPEYVITGKASKGSDVFSFGVVALEIACGRKPIRQKAQEREITLVEWVWELFGTGMLLEAVDPHLGFDFVEVEITRLMIVGLWCAHPDSDSRPSMRQAIQVLNFEAPLPTLPSKMPRYAVTSIHQSQSSSNNHNMDSSKLTTSSTASSSS